MRSRATAGSGRFTGRASIRRSAGWRMRSISKNRLDVGPSLHGPAPADRSSAVQPGRGRGDRPSISRAGSRRSRPTAKRSVPWPCLIIPPANEADYEPSRSTLPAYVSQGERARLERESMPRSARARRATRLEAADRYRKILDRHPGFAEAHFRLARCSRRPRGIKPPRRTITWRRSITTGCRSGARRALRAAYDRVAAQHPRSVLIDGRRELAAASPRSCSTTT